MSGTVGVGENAGEGEDDFDAYPADDFSMFGFVLVSLLSGYVLVGIVVLLLAGYSLLQGWTLYAGQPYWAAIAWPMGMVGLVTPAIMKLDGVTEVKRTPHVWDSVVIGYGVTVLAFAAGWLLSYQPVGFAGVSATVAFTVLCARYVWAR